MTAEYTEHLVGCPGRVGQWTQQIENRADPHLLAWSNSVFHGAVVPGREQKTHANLFDTCRHLFRAQIQPHTGCFQHIRTSRAARYGTVTMLGHLATCRRGHQRAGRGDIKGTGPVTTGSTSIYQVRPGDINMRCQFAHYTCSGDDLVDGFPFHAQAHQKTSNLCRGRLSAHDKPHHRLHVIDTQVAMLRDSQDGCFHIHKSLPGSVCRMH